MRSIVVAIDGPADPGGRLGVMLVGAATWLGYASGLQRLIK
jgi:hypothetical protein